MEKKIFFEAAPQAAAKSTNLYYDPILKKNSKLVINNQTDFYVAVNKVSYFLENNPEGVKKIVIDYYFGTIELYRDFTTTKIQADKAKDFFLKTFGNTVQYKGNNLARFKYTNIEDISSGMKKIYEEPKATPAAPATPTISAPTISAPTISAPTVSAPTISNSGYEQPYSKNFTHFLEQYSHIISEENVNIPGIGDINVPNSKARVFEIQNIVFRTRGKDVAYFYNIDNKSLVSKEDTNKNIDIKELPKLLGLPQAMGTGAAQSPSKTESTSGEDKITLDSLKKAGINLANDKMNEIVSSLSGLTSDVRNKIMQTIKDTGITKIIDTKKFVDKAIEILVPSGVFDSTKINYGVIDDKNNTITISATKPQGNHVILNDDGKMSFITAKTSANDSYNLIPRIGKIGAFFEASENLIYKDIFNINEEDGGSVKFEYALDKKDGKMKVIITGQPKIDDASIDARASLMNSIKRKWFGSNTDLKIEKDVLVKAINDTVAAPETIKALNDLFEKYENRNNIIPDKNFQETEKAIKKAIYGVIIKRDKEKSDIFPSDLQKLIKLFDDKFGIELNDKGIFADYLTAKQGQSERDEAIAGQIKAFPYKGDFFDFLNQQDAEEAQNFKDTLARLDSKKDSADVIKTYMAFIGKMPDETVVLLYNYLKDRKNPMLINTPYEGLEHEKEIIIEIREMLLKRIKSNINVLMKIILPKFRSALGDGVDMEKYYRMRIRNEFRYMGADDLKDENSQYTKTFKEIVAEMKKGRYLDKKLLLDLFNGVNAKEATLDFFTRVFGNNEKLNEKLRKAFQKEDADLEKNVETLDDKELLKKGGVFIGVNDNWKRRAYIHEVIVGFEESGKVDQADIFKIGDFTGTTPDFIKRKLFGKKNEDFRKKLKTKLEEAGLTEETIKKSLIGNKEEEAEAAKKSKKEDTASEITNPVVDRIIKDYKNGKILTDDAEKAQVLEELNNSTLSLETDERFIRKSLRIKKEDYLDAMMGRYKLISTFKKSPKELKAEKAKEEKKTEPSKEKSKEEKKKSYINKDGEIKLKNIGDAIKLITDNIERERINTLIRQMGSESVGNISDDDKSFIKRILDIDEAQYTAIVAASNRSSLLDKKKLGMSITDSYQSKDNLEKFIFSEYYNIEDKMRKRRS